MEYTIFARWNDHGYRQGRDCYFPPLAGEPKSLAERIEYVRNFHGEDSFLPVAWGTGRISFDDLDVEFAAALAAGRLIEKTASGWVALGAEKQEEDTALDRAVAHLANLFTERYSVAVTPERKHPPLDWNKPVHFDAFPGFEVTRYSKDAEPHQGGAFGMRSPDCDSGPSDHLNASRHQMAAKQFDKA